MPTSLTLATLLTLAGIGVMLVSSAIMCWAAKVWGYLGGPVVDTNRTLKVAKSTDGLLALVPGDSPVIAV